MSDFNRALDKRLAVLGNELIVLVVWVATQALAIVTAKLARQRIRDAYRDAYRDAGNVHHLPTRREAI